MMGLSFAVATERCAPDVRRNHMSDETCGFYVYSFSDGQGVVRHVAVGRPGQTPSLITRRRSVVRLIDGAEPVIIKSGLTEREAIALARELRRPLPTRLRYRRRAESQPLARIPAREVR
jgi:hypothetical protein